DSSTSMPHIIVRNHFYNLYLFPRFVLLFFFFNDPATTEIYTLSLHDALPICQVIATVRIPSTSSTSWSRSMGSRPGRSSLLTKRSEEHTSELQSPYDLVCRLLLEKKKKKQKRAID